MTSTKNKMLPQPGERLAGPPPQLPATRDYPPEDKITVTGTAPATALIHTQPPPPQFPASVGKAIIAVQKVIGKIEKKGTNKFQNYKYVAWNDICEQLSPLLAANNLILHQSETARVVERSSEGAVLAIEYAFTPVNAETGESYPPIRWTGLARLTDAKGVIDDKAAAKCHTQAEKYCSIKLFKIVTEDAIDSDAEDGNVRRAPPKPAPDVTTPAMTRPTQPARAAAQAGTSVQETSSTTAAAVDTGSTPAAGGREKKLTIKQIQELESEAREAAKRGSEVLAAFWKRLRSLQERNVVVGLQSELLELRFKADEMLKLGADPISGEMADKAPS